MEASANAENWMRTIDELNKLTGQASGILTIAIGDVDLDEPAKAALSAVRDMVDRMDTIHHQIHEAKTSQQ